MSRNHHPLESLAHWKLSSPMNILRLLLIAFFSFLVITVASFIYLEWWQALLVSVGTFVLIFYGIRWYLLSIMKRMMKMSQGMFDIKSRVLRDARVEVHSVQEVPASSAMTEYDSDEKPSPEEVAEDRAYFASLNWFVIELTIFPNPANAGLMEHWDLYDLRFVPANAKIPKGFEDISDSQEYTFDEAFVIINGQPCDPEEGKFLGPRRLRIIAGFPKNLSELKFRYYFEQFGLIHLPKNLRSLTNQ